MLKNYLKVAFRNLLKHKFYSLVDVVGLAVCITAVILVVQYVRFEWSYDDFHENAANIYRVESQFFNGTELVNDMATSAYGYATAMKEAFPEVIDFARVLLRNNERVIMYKGEKFREKNVSMADSSFLTMFSFPIVKGDPRNALVEPNTMVITESAAKKIFRDEEPIGKVLSINSQNDSYECMVTSVLRDIPENSHFKFDYLISWTSASQRFPGIDQFWYQHSAYTYVLLPPGVDTQQLERKFPAVSEKYKTRQALKELIWGIKLVPLKDIHLNPQKSLEREAKGSESAIWVLLFIAGIILVITWINFVNMATARSMGRAKEIGIRKVAGAKRKQLITQFLLESVIINVIAVFLSFLFLEIFVSYFRGMVSYPYSISFVSDAGFWLLLTFILAAGIFLSGLYPAFMLSSIKQAVVISGKFQHSSKGAYIRKGLVVWQFVATVFLIIGTLMVRQQIDFMRQTNLGANLDQVIILNAPVGSDYSREKIDVFREELLRQKEIKAVTASSSIPGKEVGMSLSNHRADRNNNEARLHEMLITDYDFIDTYELEFVMGRNFSREITTDVDALVINEEAVKFLKYNNAESAMNHDILLEGSSKHYKIIGVIKNYHHESLHKNMKPVMVCISPDYSWIRKYYYSVKVSTGNLDKTISDIRDAWYNAFQLSSFDYFFLDEYFDAQYKSDKQFNNVFGIFTFIAIFIACLGLLGLVSFNTKQKTKEIGIRKVVGASTTNVFVLLLKELIKWVVIANFIAWPIAYYFIDGWLQNYAFRTGINWWIFIISGAVALMIALFTVSFQVIKAAAANPVEALRSE